MGRTEREALSSNNRRRWPPRNSAASCSGACRPDYAGDRFSYCGFGSRSSFDAANIERSTRLVNEMAIHIYERHVRPLLPPQAPAGRFISRRVQHARAAHMIGSGGRKTEDWEIPAWQMT
ncbi:bll1231 [Bradyrhizobium diazoefficiens USDA 110]|uniref:Bll1231 protein n=1 Tax=Bradyrhizobium diazoefficiens (strain JCM 10833 / BCRC 13528 / IAM 13628 / NBRC 14792 / USDA 110) TaxID=224911 RepID=Q89V27_BRADU|nr:hypothetical protein CO678_05610 [Bradyrhizobium diazoefficiens]QBP20168.1 hypothetical protein Bdiaspc4_06075 [Bradyrhizobium diazoefficiens]BAC46496.1 bll1231 [Bradyrhizobium diazoefficiens USDA 110]